MCVCVKPFSLALFFSLFSFVFFHSHFIGLYFYASVEKCVGRICRSYRIMFQPQAQKERREEEEGGEEKK